MPDNQIYSPLSRRDAFRLAVLKAGDWSSPLELDLYVPVKPQLQGYTALSYTWGNSPTDRTVVLNGYTRHIRPNLDLALRSLRSNKEDLRIWVDALCVNPGDVDERHAQNQVMHDIFGHAKQVHAYVGTSLDPWQNYDHHLRTLENIAPVQFPASDDDAWNAIKRSFEEVEMNDAQRISPAQKCQCMFGLIRALSSDVLAPRLSSITLFSNATRARRLRELFEWLRIFIVAPWWTQTRNIQEVGVARQLQLTYGRVSVPFAMLRDAAQQLEAHPSLIPGLPHDHVKVLHRFVSQVRVIHSLQGLRFQNSLGNLGNAYYFQRSLGSPLLWLMRTFDHSREHGGKIFALSNVLTNLKTDYRELGIDHSTPVPDLLCKVAILIMQQTGLFWITSSDLVSKQRQMLPSWVPDWSHGSYRTETNIKWAIRLCHNASNIKLAVEKPDSTIQEMTPAELHRQIDAMEEHGMRKSKGRKYTNYFPPRGAFRSVTTITVELDQSDCTSRRIRYESYGSEAANATERYLNIPSLFCSTVEYVSETMDVDLGNVLSIIRGIEAHRSWPFSRDLLRMVGRVLCYGTVLYNEQEARCLGQQDEHDLEIFVMLKCFGGVAGSKPEWKESYWKRFEQRNICVSHTSIPSVAEAQKDIAIIALMETASQTAPGNRIFVTKDGKLGLGLDATRIGDQVAILSGGLCPYILRPTPDKTFALVGDGYLDNPPKWNRRELQTVRLI